MENPLHWSSLHLAVSANLENPIALTAIFKAHGYEATEEQVSAIISEWYDGVPHPPGPSVISVLVDRIKKAQ